MFALIPRDQIRSARIHRLHDYWQAKCAGRAVPDRSDIDPAELTSLLPYLLIAEVEAQPFRVFYRLVGTKVVDMNGAEFTGLYLDEMTGEQYNYIDQGIEAYRRAWSQQCPVYGTYDWPAKSGAIYLVEFCILPVTQAGSAGQFIAIEDWEISDAAAPRHDPPVPFITPARRIDCE
ncbi:PAS domain-containing protein [Dongia soli]|uniref:PAS domain-containing protein n=1 Tax=Dongia soli TaxID=600628 RepID=A0ABU5E7C1_9PROT|nr:PAS domain-containing protein [Dongia soli]MDY0882059.1 PAS domain-containing protein [Dongia soli]